ncbi:hypothetical protein SDC9_140248 [bioreactor metagenome]|uniref:Uncharacterized protein n=1 Tax=bioreactor metagenome TaxID=1076179 RepID=A0A645DXQ6_9ZZZZ
MVSAIVAPGGANPKIRIRAGIPITATITRLNIRSVLICEVTLLHAAESAVSFLIGRNGPVNLRLVKIRPEGICAIKL